MCQYICVMKWMFVMLFGIGGDGGKVGRMVGCGKIESWLFGLIVEDINRFVETICKNYTLCEGLRNLMDCWEVCG